MTHRATLRFYAELQDFLPRGHPSGEVARSFDVPGSVKDMIEACGIPHTEVDLIIVNGRSVDFGYRVREGDRISVYPVFESVDISPIARLRPEPLRIILFVADNHLGRLARYLRLLGFDTVYDPVWTDPELVDVSIRQRRILLTRDVGLLKRGPVTHGYYVRATDPLEQVKEVANRFQLAPSLRPFTRCMNCNGELAPIETEKVAHRLPPRTQESIDEYWICDSCDNLYWRGAHHSRLKRIVEAARTAGGSGPDSWSA